MAGSRFAFALLTRRRRRLFPAPRRPEQGYRRLCQAGAITEPRIDAPKPVMITGHHACAVIPCIFAHKRKGKAESEPGMFTVVTVKDGNGWKISAWAFTAKKGGGSY
ncbi:MAG: hypothetical protein GC166_00685 [Alphaproteobacteria bacterium]|nr:hypothetical protein [Alphaproteobacteria bacterium]